MKAVFEFNLPEDQHEYEDGSKVLDYNSKVLGRKYNKL